MSDCIKSFPWSLAMIDCFFLLSCFIGCQYHDSQLCRHPFSQCGIITLLNNNEMWPSIQLKSRYCASPEAQNLDKTELLFVPGKDCPHMDLLVTVLHQLWGTSAWYWTISCAAWPTSTTDPADLLSITSKGFGPRHLPPQQLQLAPGWTPCLRDQTFAAYPECCSTTQTTKDLPCDPPLPWPPLAPCSSSHQIQDNGIDLQGHQQNCPDLPPSVSQAPRPSTLLNYLSWPAGTTIAKS